MRILIIEDDIKTADYLAKGLSSSGFIVDVAHDGKEGLFMANEHAYDLIILDVMMPKLDGFSVLIEIRKSNHKVRAIMLTARGQVDDKVKGLELGADDYLVKPFSFSELLARIRAQLKRSDSTQQAQIVIADLMIDLLRFKAYRGNQRIELTKNEFKLLAYLAKRNSEVISRTMIAENVWDINFDTDTNVVDVAIKRLRKKIDDGYDKKLIHTVRGMGYVLEER